jgi:hypothetical protein
MPHACTNCGRTFPDGSKEMLSGCPDCGGNKFRYHPGSAPDSDAGDTPTAGETTETSDTPGGDSAVSPRSPSNPDDEGLPARDQGVVDRATSTVRQWVNQRSPSGSDGPAPDRPRATDASTDPDGETTQGDSPVDRPSATGSADAPATAEGTASTPDADPAAGADTPADRGTTGDDAPAAGDSRAGVDARMADTEDTAQADARTGVVDPDEIAAGAPESSAADSAGDRATGESTDTPGDSRSGGVSGESTDTPGESRPGGAPDLGTAEQVGPVTPEAAGPADAGSPAAERTAGEPADPASTPGASNLAQLREELNDQFESIKIVEPGSYELNLMELYDREEYIVSLMEDGRYAIEVPETWRDAEDRSD